MAESKPDLVTARWLGAPASLARDNTPLEYGVEVKEIPRGEVEASTNWEIVTKTQKKESE